MGKLKYKNTQFPPSNEPWGVFVGDHRDLVYEVDGFVEIEDWDDLANWHVLSSQRYELVTEDNPDPQFGDTDMLAVMADVESNMGKRHKKSKAKAENEEAQAESDTQAQEENGDNMTDNTTATFINEDGTKEKIQLPAARDESLNEPPTAEERQLLERTGNGDAEATTEAVEAAVVDALETHVENTVAESEARSEALGLPVDQEAVQEAATAEAVTKADRIGSKAAAKIDKTRAKADARIQREAERSKKGPHADAHEADPAEAE
jgi:hypothetical protein